MRMQSRVILAGPPCNYNNDNYNNNDSFIISICV